MKAGRRTGDVVVLRDFRQRCRRYTAVMTSVADQLRDESRRRVLEMSPAARMELALRLGDEDARLFAAANGVPEAEARLALIRRRQAGRQPSQSAQR